MSEIVAPQSSALATMRSRVQARSMCEAAERLVERYAGEFPAGEVLTAVSRAKALTRERFAETGPDTPEPYDYVALICLTAQLDLDSRRRRLITSAAGR